MPPLTQASAAEAPPTLLDALAHAPAAAALIVAVLGQLDRRALRLTHSQLRDAVGEATTKLAVNLSVAAAARPPTPRRWPRLEELRAFGPRDLAALEALGSNTWGRLRTLSVGDRIEHIHSALDAPTARALAAALRRMPALRALELWSVVLSDAAAAELFRASSAEAAPQLRTLCIIEAELAPAAARLLAATGWRLEELNLHSNRSLGAAGLAVLLAAPNFALRRLNLGYCGLGAADVLTLAAAPWPLEELDLSRNDFSAAAAGPALAALSRHRGLRRLDVGHCRLSAAGFKALVEAAWPALTHLSAADAKVAFSGFDALGAAAFAGFPALEELDLLCMWFGKTGAALLASRRWERLRELNLCGTRLGDAGLAALARGEWPALEVLDMRANTLGAPPTLEDARRWAPALVELH